MRNERQKIIWTKILCVMSTIVLCLAGCAGDGDTAVGAREGEAVIGTEADDAAQAGIDELPQMPEDLGAQHAVEEDNGSPQKDSGDSAAQEELREVDGNETVLQQNAAKYAARLSENSIPALENLYSYELSESGDYMVITGISPKYEITGFWAIMSKLRIDYKDKPETFYMIMPSVIDGIPVKEIADDAFKDVFKYVHTIEMPDTVEKIGKEAFMNCRVESLILPENLRMIGESAFENCTASTVQLPDCPMVIEKRAFAGDTRLKMILIADGETVLGEDVFADCNEEFLLCYGIRPDETENAVAAYAEENGMESFGVLYSAEPLIHFHDEVLTLTPEIRNYFYGEDADYESEKWCSWEEDENAPNFGFDEWQWPGCSSWCGVGYFEQRAVASSELPSGTGRYEAENVLAQNRERAWVEGAEGLGIGESITYYQVCDDYGNDVMRNIALMNQLPEHDGFMHYTEICIVNGYAKDMKTWEENGRIKRLIMYIDDKPYAYLELEDTIMPQFFSLPEDDIMVLNRKMLTVRFEIADVYPGTLYEDTCLTGLVMEFEGRYAH
ncbi:MAG: leucine-rich repeat domain-containing protein [Lachnospiraceae bacterium]|nr:leucine-rich repeat domain-containing protein [Lachnospiraceae bacterium]